MEKEARLVFISPAKGKIFARKREQMQKTLQISLLFLSNKTLFDNTFRGRLPTLVSLSGAVEECKNIAVAQVAVGINPYYAEKGVAREYRNSCQCQK